MATHPLFVALGGLPVRNDRAQDFTDAAQRMPEAAFVVGLQRGQDIRRLVCK